MAIEISGLETRIKDYFVITGTQSSGSTSILIRHEKLVLEGKRARVETWVTKVHQTGKGPPFFRVNSTEKGTEFPKAGSADYRQMSL